MKFLFRVLHKKTDWTLSMRMTLEGKGFASDNYISPQIDLIKLEIDVLGYILIENYLQFLGSFYFLEFCPKNNH